VAQRAPLPPNSAQPGLAGAGQPALRDDRVFAELDALVRDPQSGGVHLVLGELTALEALRRHLQRRLHAAGRFAIAETSVRSDEPWRGVAERLGVPGSDPRDVARGIHHVVANLHDSAEGPRAERDRADLGDVRHAGAVLVVERAPTRWGMAIRAELERIAAARLGGVGGEPLVLVLCASADSSRADASASGAAEPAAQAASAATMEFRGGVSDEGARGWWEAVASDPDSTPSLDRLDRLERWWSVARVTPSDAAPTLPTLSEEGALLLNKLALSQRPWPVADIDRLAPPGALEELLAKCVVETERGPLDAAHLDRAHHDARGAGVSGRRNGRRVRLTQVGLELAAPLDGVAPRDRLHLGHALELIAPDDPWASMRAAELFAAADEIDLAEVSAIRALGGVTEPSAREDFWARWELCLMALGGDLRSSRLRNAAEVALRVGDVDRALSLSRAAISGAGTEGFEALLVLGRAIAARGDLTAAGITLGKAMALASSDRLRARAEVELAEVSYASGQLQQARDHADSALARGPDLATRLLARNVLGKLLLARGAWDDAELHFAADGSDAECGGDAVGELRARLNRGIALYSGGRLEEARAMLRGVLDDGERMGELRGTSIALANLATIAILKHEYVDALRLSERAIDVWRRIGEKIILARQITNLAELRLRLGLIVEAEQTLAFGRSACGSDIPGARLAHFSLVAARIQLMRGQTKDAQAEINEALLGANRSSDGGRLAECHRLAARIALEDGDLARAQASIEASLAAASSDRGRAESLVLAALCARAAGEPFEGRAEEALDLAREADDDELMREAHVLLHHAITERGGAARRGSPSGRSDAPAMPSPHLEAAIALRDRVAASLPEPLRSTFLARRDLLELAQLGRRLSALGAADAGSSLARGTRRPGSRAGDGQTGLSRMVGQHASMVALAGAIRNGESGTGKELIAEALHRASKRNPHPLVKVSCAALPESLLETELFGHEKGSFTGAMTMRKGRFETANKGTIFLDEIGEMTLGTQTKLLRIIQEREFERIGSNVPIKIDIRVIAATNRNLSEEVEKGKFREDLYYRLNVIHIHMPPLRERKDDIPLLVEHFLAKFRHAPNSIPTSITEEALAKLVDYDWPGNVRELENAWAT
jgi:tetratricopeptide (TPR) repeat protein